MIEAPVLETERLILRFLTEADIAEVIRYFRANDQHFAATSPPKAAEFYTEEFWRNRLKSEVDSFEADRGIRFYLFDQKTNKELIGTAEFSQISRGPFQACYLGYGIAAKHEGKGLMKEALRAAIEFMFRERNIHRIMANHLLDNNRSAGLLERLGFAREGVAKEYLFINGSWRDHVLNSLTNREWKPAK